jgi:hypothetical protein
MLDTILLWLNIAAAYIIAAAMIAGGGYLYAVLGANPLNPLGKLFRYAGRVLIVVGIILGAVNYGKSTGAADVEANWKAKNYEAQIVRLKQEMAGHKLAASVAESQADNLASENDAAQKQIAAYQAALGPGAACRLPTADDDRRVCDIIGRSAAGCGPPGGVR